MMQYYIYIYKKINTDEKSYLNISLYEFYKKCIIWELSAFNLESTEINYIPSTLLLVTAQKTVQIYETYIFLTKQHKY